MWNLQVLVAVRTLRVWYKLTQLLKYIIYALFFLSENVITAFQTVHTGVSHHSLSQLNNFQPISTHFSISLEKNVCFCSFEPKIKKTVLIAGSSLWSTRQYFKVHCDAA